MPSVTQWIALHSISEINRVIIQDDETVQKYAAQKIWLKCSFRRRWGGGVVKGGGLVGWKGRAKGLRVTTKGQGPCHCNTPWGERVKMTLSLLARGNVAWRSYPSSDPESEPPPDPHSTKRMNYLIMNKEATSLVKEIKSHLWGVTVEDDGVEVSAVVVPDEVFCRVWDLKATGP